MPTSHLPKNEKQFVRNAIEAAISTGLVAILIFWCFDIVKPFIKPAVWGVIIAVAIYPQYQQLENYLGQRKILTAILYTLCALILLLLPTLLLVGTLVEGIEFLAKGFSDGSLSVPPPADNIRSLPLIGESLTSSWSLASRNLSAALQQLAPHLTGVAGWLLSFTEETALGLLQFMIAIIISGVLLPQAAGAKHISLMIATRLAGERGEPLTILAQETIHSVALGILGVAAIQATLAGLGFFIAGVPAAGLWALLCLLLSVLQVGISWIAVPLVIYMFYHADTFTAVSFLIWMIPVTFIDTVLKPILLSRGVQTPMVVIFMGAIGGFLTSGVIGLFIGAIILSLSYELFIDWVKDGSAR